MPNKIETREELQERLQTFQILRDVLALDVKEGRANEEDLRAAEEDLASLRLTLERLDAEERALLLREKQEKEDKRRAERAEAIAAITETRARRMDAATRIDSLLSDLAPVLLDYLTTSDALHDLHVRLGEPASWYSKTAPLAGSIAWRIRVGRLSSEFDPSATPAYHAPLSEIEEAWQPAVPSEEEVNKDA